MKNERNIISMLPRGFFVFLDKENKLKVTKKESKFWGFNMNYLNGRSSKTHDYWEYEPISFEQWLCETKKYLIEHNVYAQLRIHQLDVFIEGIKERNFEENSLQLAEILDCISLFRHDVNSKMHSIINNPYEGKDLEQFF